MGNSSNKSVTQYEFVVPQPTKTVSNANQSNETPKLLEVPEIKPKVVIMTEGLALWNKLPRDVKRLIFYFFPLKQLLHLSTICRTWSDDVYLGIRKLNFQPFYRVGVLSRFHSNCRKYLITL